MENKDINDMPLAVLSDDVLTSDELSIGSWTKRPGDWAEPTMAERLKHDFDADAEFYFVDGRPCVVWSDLDLAYDYSVAPPREIHPFTVIEGSAVDLDRFKAYVREIHKL